MKLHYLISKVILKASFAFLDAQTLMFAMANGGDDKSDLPSTYKEK